MFELLTFGATLAILVVLTLTDSVDAETLFSRRER